MDEQNRDEIENIQNVKQIKLTESGERKIIEALRRHEERQKRIEPSLLKYAKNGRYSRLINYSNDKENPEYFDILEKGNFGELVYLRGTKLNKKTGEIIKENLVDITNVIGDIEKLAEEL